MQYQEEFDHLIEGLKEAGFKIPKFHHGYVSEDQWYIANIVEKKIVDLGLEVALDIGFDIDSLEKEVTLEDLLSGEIRMKVRPFVNYQSLYSEDQDMDYPIDLWHNLVSQIQVQLKLLTQLEDFLPKEDYMAFARKSIATLSPALTWGQLYGKYVRMGNLKWFEFEGKRIPYTRFPYVTTTVQELGDIGRSEGGLYFVATDVAKEPWQEMAVVYHERFCQERNHKFALRKEKQLARKLGKEKEHAQWRESVRDLWKNGGEGK